MKKVCLPETDSIEELAEFWDTNDVTDFDDELEEVMDPVFVRGSSEPILKIQIPLSTFLSALDDFGKDELRTVYKRIEEKLAIEV